MDSNFDISYYVCNIKSSVIKSHIVKDPVQLECSKYACKSCILQNLNDKNNYIKCNCDFGYHSMAKDQLIIDDNVTKLLETNLSHFYDWIQNREIELLGN